MKKSLIAMSLGSLVLLGACGQKQTSKLSHKTEEKMFMKDDKMANHNTMMTDKDKTIDFSLMGIDGKTYKLSDFKGKKVYLKFWASWCSICLSSLPDTEELAMEQGEDYVVLSVISPNQKGEKSAEEFKKWYDGLQYKHIPVLLDEGGKMMEAFGIRAYPTSVFIGSDGALAETHVGFMSKMDIKNKLEAIR